MITLFLFTMGVLNLLSWWKNVIRVRELSKEMIGLVIHFLVILLIFLFALFTGKASWNLAMDLQANKATVFLSTTIGNRIAHGGRGGPAYYLDFDRSAPVTELRVSQSIYSAFQSGQSVTVSYTPCSRVVLDVNGVKGY